MRRVSGMSSRARWRHLWTTWFLAPVVPAASWGIALLAGVDAHAWHAISRPMLRALVADALLWNAACLLLVAPVAGIVVVRASARVGEGRGAFRAALAAAWPLAITVLLLTGTSAMLALLATGGEGGTATFIATSHTTQAAVGLALALIGALCGRVFRDPLDAAACSLGLVIVATGGLLLGGAPVADAPGPLIDVAAVANPLLAMASAAHVDLVRMDLLYRISPLAHMRFQEPAWEIGAASYAVAALVLLAGLVVTYRTRRPRVVLVGAQTREPARFAASEDWL